MGNKKIYTILCGLGLMNAYSNGIDGKILGRTSAGTLAAYYGLNRTARLFINTGNLKTQKLINLFRKDKPSTNYASISISQYKNPCKNKFWSEQKLKSGGRMIIYSPKQNVQKVWMCFAGCSSYGLDILEDVWRSTVPVDEPNTAFVAVDYPGYGTEAPGNLMSKEDLKNIAMEVVDKISEKYSSADKCIHGHSLGSFPASWTVGDDRIKEIHLHSPVNLSRIPNKFLGSLLVLLNAENLNSIDNLLTQAKKRKTPCKVTIVSGGREKQEQKPGQGPYEFLCLKNTLTPEYGKYLKKLVEDGKITLTCKIKRSAGHCEMFKMDDSEVKNYNYMTGKIEECPQ